MATRTFTSLVHFAQFTQAVSVSSRSHRHALEEASQLLENRSRQVIGTYDIAPRWRELEQSTQDQRRRQGFPPNEPLLRTGALRDSLAHNCTDHDARVGSNYDVAVYQELGTSKMPPRSFLRSAAIEQEANIVAILSRGLVASLVPGSASTAAAPLPGGNRGTRSSSSNVSNHNAAMHVQRSLNQATPKFSAAGRALGLWKPK